MHLSKRKWISDDERQTLGVNHVYAWPWIGAIEGSVKMNSVCMRRLVFAQELLHTGLPGLFSGIFATYM